MTAGIVLCGGKSSRMGTNKAELIFLGKPMREHMKSVLLNAGIERVYFSGPDGIVDTQAGFGPLSGISSCLNTLLDEKSLLFVPVDMPLLSADLVSMLLKSEKISECKSDVVRFEKQHFPMLLKNNNKIRQLIEQQLTQNKLALHQLFKRLPEILIKHKNQSRQFDNINTPEDWREVSGSK